MATTGPGIFAENVYKGLSTASGTVILSLFHFLVSVMSTQNPGSNPVYTSETLLTSSLSTTKMATDASKSHRYQGYWE